MLHACEATIERLATDRHYFAKPARHAVQRHPPALPDRARSRASGRSSRPTSSAAQEWLASQPQHGYDINGNPLECRATTRRGTPCQRMPLAHNGYCPSHQHLAETEELERTLAA